MKITLIGNTTGATFKRLHEEAQNHNVDFRAVAPHSLILEVKGNTLFLRSKKYNDLLDSDCFIFRGIGEADQEMMVIAKHLLRHNITVIEEKTADGALMMDKMFLQAIEESVPTPDFHMVQGEDALQEITAEIEYPAVMKSTVGSMGNNVALIHTEEELFAQYALLGERVIVQEYLPVEFDVRAIVVGGKYVGSYKRTRDDGEFRMNKPGNHKEAITLPPEAIAICEKAAKSQSIEIAGVDLTQFEGQWYVLEINTSPQFSKFEECTGINVAELIIQYAIKKVQSK